MHTDAKTATKDLRRSNSFPYIKGLRPQTRFGAQPAKPALSAEMSCPEGTEGIKAVPSYENRAPRRIRICAGWDLRWSGFAAVRPHPAACRIDPLRAPPNSPWLPRGAPSGSIRCSPKHSAASGLCRRCGERKPVPGVRHGLGVYFFCPKRPLR